MMWRREILTTRSALGERSHASVGTSVSDIVPLNLVVK
jgi:hypothetical protein